MLSNVELLTEADKIGIATPALKELQKIDQGIECLKICNGGKGKAVKRVLHVDMKQTFLFYSPSRKDLLKVLISFAEMIIFNEIPAPLTLEGYFQTAVEIRTEERKLVLMFKTAHDMNRFVKAISKCILDLPMRPENSKKNIDPFGDYILTLWNLSYPKGGVSLGSDKLTGILQDKLGKHFSTDKEIEDFVRSTLDLAKCPLPSHKGEDQVDMSWSVDLLQFGHVLCALMECPGVAGLLFQQYTEAKILSAGMLMPEQLLEFFTDVQCEQIQDSIVMKMIAHYARFPREEPSLTFGEFCAFMLDSKVNSWCASSESVEKAFITPLTSVPLKDCVIFSAALDKCTISVGRLIRNGVRFIKMNVLWDSSGNSFSSSGDMSGTFGSSTLKVMRFDKKTIDLADALQDIVNFYTNKMTPLVLLMDLEHSAHAACMEQLRILNQGESRMILVEDDKIIAQLAEGLRGKILVIVKKQKLPRQRGLSFLPSQGRGNAAESQTGRQRAQTLIGLPSVTAGGPAGGTKISPTAATTSWLETFTLSLYDNEWKRSLEAHRALHVANRNMGYFPKRLAATKNFQLCVRVLFGFGFFVSFQTCNLVVEVAVEELDVDAEPNSKKVPVIGQKASARTKNEAHNALLPQWNEKLGPLDVSNKITTLISVRVFDLAQTSRALVANAATASGQLIGEGIVSLRALRLGVRAIPLVDEGGNDISIKCSKGVAPRMICCHFSLMENKPAESHEPAAGDTGQGNGGTKLTGSP